MVLLKQLKLNQINFLKVIQFQEFIPDKNIQLQMVKVYKNQCKVQILLIIQVYMEYQAQQLILVYLRQANPKKVILQLYRLLWVLENTAFNRIAAYGAVGQIVVQLAKNYGCKVIGLAGTDLKCKEVMEIFKADYCINYKTQNIQKELKKLCQNGIDIYFDNVGGEILDIVINQINKFARIVLCGAISGYNKGTMKALKNYSRLIIQSATMQGFIVMNYQKHYLEAIAELREQQQNGQLVFNVHEFHGLDQAPKALQSLLLGENKGKVIVNCQQLQPKI